MKTYLQRLALLALLLIGSAASAFAQTSVTSASGISFGPSPNDGVNANGTPIVSHYQLSFQPGTGCAPVASVDLGKPAPVAGVITVQPIPAFGTLTVNCVYTATVSAIGPGGTGTSVMTGQFELFGGGSGQGTLLQPGDLTCNHVFRSPYFGTGSSTSFYPINYYYSGGQLRFFMIGGDDNIYEFADTGSAPCDTPWASIPQASYGLNYGSLFPVIPNNATGSVPGYNSNNMWAGIKFDTTLNELVISASSIYTGIYIDTNYYTFTLDPIGQTKTLKSCFGFNGLGSARSGWGFIDIPPYFQSAYLSPGQRWSIGRAGGYPGPTAGTSAGIAGYAVDPSAFTGSNDTACAAATSYLFPTAKELVAYDGNSSGPTCAASQTGCTPVGVPTSPYPQRLAWTNYSISAYNEDWDPAIYNGVKYGWIAFTFSGATYDWYKSTNREGLLVAYSAPSGWIYSPIAASPAPTYGPGDSGSFTLSSADTHDGGAPNIGDNIWIPTCTPGTDVGCSTENRNHESCGLIDSISGVAPSAITYHITNSLCGRDGAGVSVVSWSITSAGTGYAVNDLVSLLGGTYGGRSINTTPTLSSCNPESNGPCADVFTVTSVNGGGGITGLTLATGVTPSAPPVPGNPYDSHLTNPVTTATNGAGSGATLSITSWHDSDHKPIVGANVEFGAVYAHGNPGSTRFTNRLQIINPTELAATVGGRDPSLVGFTYDFDMTHFMPQWTTPNCALCVLGGGQYGHGVNGIMADGAHNKAIISTTNGQLPGFTVGGLVIYVFDVAP